MYSHTHKKTILPIQDWLHKARIWWSPGVTHTHRGDGKMKKRISRNLWKLQVQKRSSWFHPQPPPKAKLRRTCAIRLATPSGSCLRSAPPGVNISWRRRRVDTYIFFWLATCGQKYKASDVTIFWLFKLQKNDHCCN